MESENVNCKYESPVRCNQNNRADVSHGDGHDVENVSTSQENVSLCSEEKLCLASWGLPEKVLEFYRRKGITHMFQWQLECLSLGGVLDAGNLVYSAPTSAGKTLVAEVLISKTLFEVQKKALVILPFVSVVREKMFYFQSMYNSSGIHVEGYMGGHSPSIPFKQVHVAVCTIEKANAIINRLLEEQSLHNLGLVVVDELHLLGDQYRGYLLELLLTKLKYISLKSDVKIQVVGMSATLPNLKSLADWLQASLYYTDFRPVPLNEKLKCGTVFYDKKLNKVSDMTVLPSEASDDSENIGQMCVETIANGHSVLIFCPTKVWCENLAEKIALFFRRNGCSKSAEVEGTPGWILRKELNLKRINDVIEHLKMSPVGLDKDLHRTVAYGVAFHHAGLTLDERDIIEGSFRQGSIRVLCATSTLSSGVNLPARRVIIRSPMSFGGLMDILTYRQMIGRAGRMGVDSEGESILICKANEKTLCQTLMCSTLKPIESCLGHGRLSASLKRALLEIIASGIAASPEEVKSYADCTFLAFSSKHDIEDPIKSCIDFLEENEFIRLQENGSIFAPTPLGKACLASSLPPDEGLALFRELQRARRCFVLDTDLHIIYQVTPYSVSEQWSKVDWLNVLNTLESLPPSMKRVGEMVGVEEAFLVRVAKGTVNTNDPENRNKLSIHRRFYTSLALQDLVNEVPLSVVAEKYECNKGMLQSLQQSAATYAGMVTEFTKCLGWGSVELIFSQFQERLQFGIQRELCELMRLPLLNPARARVLFNAGFTSLVTLANANVVDLENAFLQMVPFQSKKEIAGETTYEKDQRNKLETIWITGKADLSIRDAAELLVTEARSILELELGLERANWGKKETSLTESMMKSQNNSMMNHSMNRTMNRTLNRSIGIKANKSAGVVAVAAAAPEDTGSHHTPATTAPAEKYNNEVSRTTANELTHIESRALVDSESNRIAMDDLGVGKVHNEISIKGPLDESGGVPVGSNQASNAELRVTEVHAKEEVVNSASHKSLICDNNVPDSNDMTEQSCRPSECTTTDEKRLSWERKVSAENEKMKPPPEQMSKSSLRNSTSGKKDDFNFTSSFIFDMIPDYITEGGSDRHAESCRVDAEAVQSGEEEDAASSESGSLDLVDDFYDSRNDSKGLSFSRLSEDMFGRENGSNKKMSTPLHALGVKNVSDQDVSRNRLVEMSSPDLFSQSLTFDTQLGRILDFEEEPPREVEPNVHPSTSFNSDDLGFVSDLSPQKPIPWMGERTRQVRTEDVAPMVQPVPETSSSVRPNVSSPGLFGAEPADDVPETGKRKADKIDSPDVIVDSDESAMESHHVSKRVKRDAVPSPADVDKSDLSNAVVNDSDDEIMPTPKLDKVHLSNISNIRRLHDSSMRSLGRSCVTRSQKSQAASQKSRLASQNLTRSKKNSSCLKRSKHDTSKSHVNRVKMSLNASFRPDRTVWDKMNVVDVCDGEDNFKFFCDKLNEQNIVGMALGCRRKVEEKKNLIGSRIVKKRKSEVGKTGNGSNGCHYKDVVLDGIAFYWKGNTVSYMTLDDRVVPVREKIDILKSGCHKRKTFRAYDVKEQMKMLRRCCSVSLPCSFEDPKVAAWLLAETWKEKNFTAMAAEYLPSAKGLASQLGSVVGFSGPGMFAKSPVSHRTRACAEALITFHMVQQQLQLLQSKGLEQAFVQTEMPIMTCLAEMELAGFQISRPEIVGMKERLDGIKESLEAKAYELAGHKFSMSSSAAISKVLFKELNLEVEKIAVTKKRKLLSTNKQALESLAEETNHPLPRVILEWRKIRSILTKFVAALLQISAESDRVYGVCQTFTVTGRISMHEPNLQNIPKAFNVSDGCDDAAVICLRDAFVPSDGCLLLSADYSQIELRILAHLSEDPELIRSICEASDIFVNLAANVYGIQGYEVDESLRQRAKQTCYGIIYGVGPKTLSETLGIDESEAVALTENFKNKFSGLKNYIEKTVSECRKRGYVTTLLGRRRYLPAVNDSNPAIRAEAERQAINTTIQGSAADLIKTATISWRDKMDNVALSGITINTVLHLHDELIFEVQRDAVEAVAVMLKETMEGAMELIVPTPVKVKTGSSWGQLKNLEF